MRPRRSEAVGAVGRKRDLHHEPCYAQRMTARSPISVALAALLLTQLTLLIGCDLPGIPFFGPVDDSDVRTSPDSSNGPIACAASTRRCVGNTVRICSADGLDFSVEACGAGETCDSGRCAPVQDTCSGSQPFALSATELAFDVSDDLKTQTKQLRLENCGTTALTLRSAVVRTPERPDGRPVFELTSDVAQTSVPAGGSLDLKVVYRPTVGLSHVLGKLELSLILNELTNVEISLRSKAVCAAATTSIDFEIRRVGEFLQADGVLQNCGTDPIVLQGWDIPPTYEVEFPEKLPLTMESGDEVSFVVEGTPTTAGFLDARVRFSFNDPFLDPTTSIHGLAGNPDCEHMLLAEHQLLVNNTLGLDPRPGSLLRLRFPAAPAHLLHWVQISEQPRGSYTGFQRVTDGWVLRPRAPGRYVGEVTGFDVGTGRVSCGSLEVAIDVDPGDGLFVELSWSSEDDGIPEDRGFGHGANLDLHVLSSRDGDAVWNDSETDCFPGAVAPCGEAGGRVSISESGGIPEFVQFEELDDHQFEIGIYLSNPFNFEGTDARVRVYRHGELIAELESDSLRSANDFWLVGRWDEEEQTWTEINRVFTGFPK